MQKKMLPVKTYGTEKKNLSCLFFFLPVGEMKKCTEKEQKKVKKYVKNSLHFRGQNAIL